jgi:hypothetical protein
MEREIAEQEREIAYRQARKKLIFEASPDFLSSCPRYVQDGASSEEITARCRAAHQGFLAQHDISKPDHQILWLFLNQHPEADISNPETWDLAWQFVQSALAPFVPAEPQYDEQPVEQPVEQSVQPEADAKPLTQSERDIQDRKDATADWIQEMIPNCEAAIDSLEASSGLVMQREQRLELAAHFNKRCANSRRPIPPTVAEWRKTAWQLWKDAIGPTQEEYAEWNTADTKLSSEEYARKVGRINGYAPRPFAVTAARTRDVEG